VRPTRRDVTSAATLMFSPSLVLAATRRPDLFRILTDRPTAPRAGAIRLPQGRMVDHALIASLQPGPYRAALSPANLFLLIEVLRDRGQTLSPTHGFTLS